MSFERGGHFGGQHYNGADTVPVPESVADLYDPARMEALGQIAWPLSEEQLLLLAAMELQDQRHVTSYEAGKIDTSDMKVSSRLKEMSDDIDYEYYILSPLRNKELGPKLAAQGWTKENALDDGDTYLDAVEKLKEELQPDWIKKRATVVEQKPNSGKHAAPKPDRVDQIGNLTEVAMEFTGRGAKKVKEFAEDPENRVKIAAGVTAVAVGASLLPKPAESTPRPGISVVAASERGLLAAGAALGGQDAKRVTLEQAIQNMDRLTDRLAGHSRLHGLDRDAVDVTITAARYYTHHADKLHPETHDLHHTSLKLVRAIVHHPHAVTRGEAKALSQAVHGHAHLHEQFIEGLHGLDPHMPKDALHALAALLTAEELASVTHHHDKVHRRQAVPYQRDHTGRFVGHAPEHHVVAKAPGHKIITVHDVKKILPHAPDSHIKHYTPLVIEALKEQHIYNRIMAAYAFATINAETPEFAPIREYGDSEYFKQYDYRPDLGNIHEGDGEKYAGEGFEMLTGLANFKLASEELGLDLVDHPEKAREPEVAARVLAWFLAKRKQHIMQAVREDKFALARTYVNGGTNGLDRFLPAFHAALEVFTNDSGGSETNVQAQQPAAPEQSAGVPMVNGLEVANRLKQEHENVSGMLSQNELQPLGSEWPDQQLYPDAAKAFGAMNEAFKATFGHDMVVKDSYRSFARQQQIKDDYEQQGIGSYAAVPGTSNHGWGLAIDLGGGVESFGSPEHAWLNDNATTYGFWNPVWAHDGVTPDEAWHYEFIGSGDPGTN